MNPVPFSQVVTDRLSVSVGQTAFHLLGEKLWL